MAEGNYGQAALDAFGIAVDTAALATPLPGGAGALRNGGRFWDGVEAAREGSGLMQTVRKTQLVDQSLNVTQGIAQATHEFREGNYGWGAFYSGMSALGLRQIKTNLRPVGLEPNNQPRYASFRNVHDRNLQIYRREGINPLRTSRLRREIRKSAIGRQILDAADNDTIHLTITGTRISDDTLLGESIGRRGTVFTFNTQSYTRTAETAIHEGVHALGVGGSRRAEALARLAEIKHQGGVIDRAAMQKVLTDMGKNYDHFRWKIYKTSPHFPGVVF